MKIENLDIDKVKSIIVKWAQEKSFITKVYLFGSRISGESKKTGKSIVSNSDLDVALEFKEVLKNEDPFTAWTAEAKNWHKELLSLLGFENEKDLDLQWHHPKLTPHVAEYVKECSILIYITMEKWLEELINEAFLTFHHLDMFKQLGGIIDKNESLKKMDQTILEWLRGAFNIDLVIGICRIIDKKEDSLSLVRFLHELKTRDDYLSRKRYIEKYNNTNNNSSAKKYMLEMASEHFDNLAGKGAEKYPVSKIEEDISMLTQQSPCRDIVIFRNHYMAHLSKIKYSAPPTYSKLFDAFEVIEGVLKKYNLVINAANLISMTPTPQGYWEEVLTIPWLTNKSGNVTKDQ